MWAPKGEEPSLVLALARDLLTARDASLLTPETMNSGGTAPVGCIALKTEGPGCVGDVPWRGRALTAGRKLIQMQQQYSASCLPAKGDGRSSCPFTTSKAAHSTQQQREK